MNKKCYECGNQIEDKGVTMPGIPASFCDVECYKKHTNDYFNQKYSNPTEENKDA